MEGLVALSEKLGPVLWMLAARRKFDRDDIAAFLDLLPQTSTAFRFRHVIEPRHETFRDEAFFVLAGTMMSPIVFGDDDEFPCIDADTASFAYARLQRMREEFPTGYDDARARCFRERARRGEGRAGHLFVHDQWREIACTGSGAGPARAACTRRCHDPRHRPARPHTLFAPDGRMGKAIASFASCTIRL